MVSGQKIVRKGSDMGFFSWDCKQCGHSILNPYSIGPCQEDPNPEDRHDNEWMMWAVVVEEDDSSIKGEYDGYGRLHTNNFGTVEIDGYEPCMYHVACWEKAGKPGYTGPSESSLDQGYFFGIHCHDLPDPRVVSDEEFQDALKKASENREPTISEILAEERQNENSCDN